MSDPTMNLGEIALAVVACPRCGACPGQSCAEAMRRKLDEIVSPDACRELDEIARGAPQLAHPERLKEADLPPPERYAHPDGLAAAKACAIAGRCVFCEEQLVGRSVYCFGATQPRRGERGYDCFRAFQRAYYRDVRARRRAAAFRAQEEAAA